MLITVVICTWNRSKLLDQTLSRMAMLRIPPGVEWELLVVNNNSPDNTAEVIERHFALGKLPIRPLFEQKQGLSNARNCAVAAATGELMIWTDDDVLVEPNWIEEYLNAAERYPEATYFAGTIKPVYEIRPPDWVIENISLFSGPHVILDFGPDVRPLISGELPYGANMGFRTEAIRNRPFNARLGRIGTHLLSGEETLYCEGLAKDGHTGIWVGRALLYHHVPAERLTWDFVRRWYYGYGASEVRASFLPGRYWFGVPRYMWKRKMELLRRRIANTCLLRKTPIDTLLESIKLDGAINELRSTPRNK